jgi:hypothetical protein
MLTEAGFAEPTFPGWTGYFTSPYTQVGLITARKPGRETAAVVVGRLNASVHDREGLDLRLSLVTAGCCHMQADRVSRFRLLASRPVPHRTAPNTCGLKKVEAKSRLRVSVKPEPAPPAKTADAGVDGVVCDDNFFAKMMVSLARPEMKLDDNSAQATTR